MREFTSAVEDVIDEDERNAKIQTILDEAAKAVADLVAEGMSEVEARAKAGKSREDAEREIDLGKPIEFMLDGRVMHAYQPTDGQLAFMLASLGRGQTSDGRAAATINVMMECLRDDDKDYFESRLLTHDPKTRLGIKTIESVFEMLTEEWFARPTQ